MRPPLAVRTYTIRNLRKIAPTFIILTFVVMVVIVILSTLRGIKDGTMVFAREFNHFSVVLPKKKSSISDETRKRIAEHPSVERVVESRNCMVRVQALIAKLPFQIRSVRRDDMEYMMSRMKISLLEGTLPEPETNEVALHEIFMKANGWKVGAEFGMDVAADDWMPGRFRVVGILGGETPVGLASLEFVANPFFYLFASKLWERTLVFAKPGREAEMNAFLESIDEAKIWTHAKAEEEIGASFDRLLLVVNFVSFLLIGVVALVVGLIHNIFFAQRSDEFAILLAVGHTQRRLLAKVMLETALLMSIAWIAGAGLALGSLAAFKTLVLEPKGIPLPMFQIVPILASLAMPLVAQVFATWTVFGRLRKFDPVQIIERRG